MSSTQRLQWWVDEHEYERFREFVAEERGVAGLCFPSAVRDAMRAFIDKDRAALVEETIDTFEDVLADSLDGYSRRRTSTDPLVKDDLGGEDTKKVRCKVPTALKEEFAIYVDENSEWGKGEALGRAMNAYRDGGREQRMVDRLENMMASVESVDTAQNDESESKPYSKEEKIEAIRTDILDRWPEPVEEIEEIDGMIPMAWFTESIDRWCTRGDREQATDRTRNKYLDLVADEFGLYRDGPNFIVGEPDGLAFERRSYDALSTEERVEAVHVHLLRNADARHGAQVSAAGIRDDIFDGKPHDSVANDLRKRAAEKEGFGTRKAGGGDKTVYVSISKVSDERLLEAAGLLEQRRAKEQAQAEWSDYDQAEPVRSDGGRVRDTSGGER